MRRLHNFRLYRLLPLLAVLLLGLPAGPARAQGRASGETEEERIFSEAEAHFNAGRYAEAAPLYDRALALNPGRPAALVKRATLYFRDRAYDRAIELLTRAEKLAPEDLSLKTVLGLCLYQKGDKARALSYLEDVARRRPEAYEAQLQIGQHYAQSDPDRAIAALGQYFRYRPAAEEQGPLDVVAQLFYGTAYLLKGQFAEARRALEAAYKERPQDRRTALLLGAAALAQGDYERARALHLPLVRDIPRRPRIAYDLALACLKLRRYPEARRYAEQYQALRPADPHAAVLLGDIALAAPEADGYAALRHYEDAARIRPAAPGETLGISVDARLARAYLQAHEPARAIAVAEARLSRLSHPEPAPAGEEAVRTERVDRTDGRTRGRGRGHHHPAREPAPPTPDLRLSAPAKDGEEAELIAVILEAHLQQGTPQGAQTSPSGTLGLSNRLVQLAPRDAPALALAGSGALLSGSTERARRYYGEALTLDSSLPRARAGMARSLARQATALLEEKGDEGLTAALPLLEQAQQLDPGPTTARNLALVYLLQLRPDAAERLLVPLVTGNGAGRGDPVLLRLYGRALLGLSRTGPALVYYERAQERAAQQLPLAVDRERRQLALEVLVEVRTELGGRYLAASRPDQAIEVLERGLREAAGVPEARRAELLPPLLRNLSLSYLLRGKTRLLEHETQLGKGAPPAAAAGKLAEAALEDLQKAVERGGLAPGPREAGATLCAAALAAVRVARYGPAREFLRRAQGEGGCELVSPYDKLGADLLLAYVSYRDTGSPAQREQALRSFSRLLGRAGKGPAAEPLLELLRALQNSTSQMLAFDYYTLGKLPRAAQLLRGAVPKPAAGTERKPDPVLEHNLAVLDLLGGRPAAERVLERLGGRPPEALVNLGILADRRGDSKKALDYYKKALERGARTPRLREWIDVKERLLQETP